MWLLRYFHTGNDGTILVCAINMLSFLLLLGTEMVVLLGISSFSIIADSYQLVIIKYYSSYWKLNILLLIKAQCWLCRRLRVRAGGGKAILPPILRVPAGG